ncbi:MAG TPA: glycosyltransferase family 4 protein [Candidatus Eisenbacteria bacterium]|nr:glycosyltransferase family 4 protein [Candidatus Eisenbacteria bacterium]
MRLRIGIVSQAYVPTVGGVTEHVDATAKGLRRRGHDVTVVTSGIAGRPRFEPGTVRVGHNIVLPYNGAQNDMTVGFDLPERLGGLFEERRFDVIHVHCPVAPVLPLLTLRLARVPVVGTFHSVSSDLPYRLFGGLLRPLYRRIDHRLAVSVVARDYIQRHFPGPVEVLPNGVDLDRFRPRATRDDDGVPTILFVGRLDPRKGLPDLIDACTILARLDVPFRLVVVGDGPLRERMERRARRALDGRVEFAGRVEPDLLPGRYAAADIFCTPARSGESFGLVLLEAMATGIPIVATSLPGYRTVLTPEAEGILVEPRDVEAMALALRRLLADAELRATMGARGVETARRYGWDGIVERLEQVYASLLPVRLERRLAAVEAEEREPEFETAVR